VYGIALRAEDRRQFIEVGIWTRRRPKRKGLCRGKHAEVGKNIRYEREDCKLRVDYEKLKLLVIGSRLEAEFYNGKSDLSSFRYPDT
jgi:hypothetical protein